MNRRERLMATLRGEPVDRPPVSFYEITGLEETGGDDPFNIYSHPSWAPLIKLAAEKTDRIARCKIPLTGGPRDPWDEFSQIESWQQDGSLFTRRTVKIGRRELTAVTRRDPDVNTVWDVEPLLKNPADLKALLELPPAEYGGQPEIAPFLEIEKQVGDSGIVMIDTPDPLCLAAILFEMGEFTIAAMTERKLFHQLMERFAALLHPKTQAVAQALPGRHWRIYGPEYASPPFLPPRLFREYVVGYVTPMVNAIHKEGGFARIHSHGNLKDILDDIVATGCMGLDPVEPPPQGDVELSYVREKYGQQLVLFGNLEASDITNLPTPEFEHKVRRAIREGTAGAGRGFVLMPSGAPYGRKLPPLALANYQKMVEICEQTNMRMNKLASSNCRFADSQRRNIMKFPYLETSSFTAYIADNAPLGIHRRGYNGLAALIPRHSGNNLFVPTYAGLNYETISLAAMPAYRYEPRKEEHQSIFEPRCEPMHIESADTKQVVLVQPETAHAGVSARITFRVAEPHYLHQRIELTFHHRFCAPGEPNHFSSLWASYMHMPPDVHIYLKPDWQAGDNLAGWLGVVKADHRAPVQFCPLPDGELDAGAHLEAMKGQTPLSMPQLLDGPLAFYYGFCHGSQLLLKMFKQPEQFKLAYSPCGGGTEPAWSPAWDYVLHLDDAQLGQVYTWDLCLVVKEYRGRADILDEVRRYME